MVISGKSYLWVQNGSDDPVQVTPDDLEPDTVDGKPTLDGEPCVKLKQAFKDLHGIT